jgi:hypothetical protein
MELAFDEMYGYFWPMHRKGTFFKFLRCSYDFVMKKVFFFVINASLRWLNNVLFINKKSGLACYLYCTKSDWRL